MVIGEGRSGRFVPAFEEVESDLLKRRVAHSYYARRELAILKLPMKLLFSRPMRDLESCQYLPRVVAPVCAKNQYLSRFRQLFPGSA